ncbi:MAG: DUF4474 domain-containing protein [Solirubrobacterales bacterium]
MRKAQNIDSLTWTYLTFILGLGAVYLTRGKQNSKLQLPDEIKLIADAIAEKRSYEDLQKLIKSAGYTYDPEQDIFYSTIYPWQRSYGYCHLFDEAAAVFSMIIDCEPIYFEYEGKRWFVGLWKGQYGMTTGGEVGVYYTDKPDVNVPGIYKGPFYRSITDRELLEMSYKLYKNDRLLFTRSGMHWWLAGFRLGDFSEPKELSMDISIKLKDEAMRDAFIGGLSKAGYTENEFKVNENTVQFTFDKPKTPQPTTRYKPTDWAIQRKNQLLCILFNVYTMPYTNSMDKIMVIEEQFPELYKVINLLAGIL